MGVPWSTWEYLGVLLLFCVFELGVPGSTWEYLGEPGSTWEYLGVPGSTTLVSPINESLSLNDDLHFSNSG